MAYSFDPIFAADPSNPANVAANAAILIYDPNDAGKAPVTITDLTGSPLPNPVTVNKNGFGSAFQHATLDRLAWSGAGFEGFFTSYEGMKNVAIAAQEAAETAASTAAAEAAEGVAPVVAEAEAAADAAAAAQAAAASSATAAANSAALVGAPADTAIAAAINGTATATKAALTATTATAIDEQVPPIVNTAVERVRLKNDFGFMGDSITIGGDSPGKIGQSWPAYASVMSQQRIHYVVNAAIAGQTTNSMVPRLQADIIDKGVGTCVILAGTNDIQTGMTMAQWQTNMTTMVDMLHDAGVTPVLCTIPPNNTTPAWKPLVVKYNAWLRRFAEGRGITVIDFYGALVNPATGDYITGLDIDGVHPSDAGYRAMAALAIEVLTPQLPNNRPPLAQDNLDTNNLAVNGLAITDSNADGLADNWKTTPGTLPAGATVSLVTDPAVPGKLQRLTVTGTSTTTGIGYYKTTGLAAGNRIAVAGRITKTAGIRLDLSAISYGGTSQTFRPLQNLSGAITNGIFYLEFVMPTGGNQVEIAAILQPGTGTLDLGQLTIYNLTALGLA